MTDYPTPPKPTPVDPLAEPPAVQPEMPPPRSPPPPSAAVPPAPPPAPPIPAPAGRPTAEQVQAQIQEALVEGELRLRQWLDSPQGRDVVQKAKVAVPVAAVGVAGLAAAWLWSRKARRTHRQARQWDNVRRTFRPMNEEGRPSLDYLRETLLGMDAGAVETLLGPPTSVALEGLIWQYRLDADVGDHSPDPAAIELAFNDAGEVGEVTFLMRPETT